MGRSFEVDDVLGPPPAWPTLVRRGLRRQCSRCACRDVFVTRYRLRDRCPGCGYRFRREPGFFLGAWFINFMVIEILHFSLVMVFIVWKASHPDSGVLWPFGIGLATAVIVPVVCYPWSQTLWAALDLAFTPLELAEIVDAADALEEAADQA